MKRYAVFLINRSLKALDRIMRAATGAFQLRDVASRNPVLVPVEIRPRARRGLGTEILPKERIN